MTKILLVEDDKSLREIYGVRLLAEGYDIISAGNGEEALAMAIKERPALVVSDVMMPKISGFDMLDILRSTTETRDIKVIMMTALSSEDQRQRGQQLGADRFLVKSQVGIEDVVRTVHEVLDDAPTTSPTPFSAPTPAVAQPQPTAAPAAPPTPAPQPVAAPIPQPNIQVPERQPTPVPQPAAPSTPTPPAPQAPEPPLPQPTAPFSTDRPSTTNRVIEPIQSQPAPATPVADQIQQELDRVVPSAPLQPTAPVHPAPAPQQTAQTLSEDHGMNFEETATPQPQQTPPTPSV